ncbi:DUF1707 SHOCT-like domain-containing protein [Mycolicibacterium moriokaense]|uniref:Uncharacterized protein DUF1707 n=1 Tax=Mycolicibacterium moriokaense TaxID=39691 RepID=A0A318HDD0_9MYCO|nr:DUF1707 domain-containing protein [Mycolicibacterium moriokaense]PXX06360.1 uncharacterized protein DUF1707 [Mycolicibacterium moriokaense]
MNSAPYTRATDSDRNDTCQVLDSALAEGQLSMEEHRERVSAATKATNLGELQSLVSDLQVLRAPSQVPATKTSGDRSVVRIAVLCVLTLVGAGIVVALFSWALHGSTPSPSKTTAAPTTEPAVITSSTPPPPPAPPQLLTLGGLSGLLAQMQSKFGDTLGYELTVYPNYAVLQRPDAVNAHETVMWNYRGPGSWTPLALPSLQMPPGTSVGDLSKFDVQGVLDVLPGAPQSLHIPNPKNTYLIIDSAKDGTLSLSMYLSDDNATGYFELASDGTVKRIYAAGE